MLADLRQRERNWELYLVLLVRWSTLLHCNNIKLSWLSTRLFRHNAVMGMEAAERKASVK